jgi:hypothetical protein
VAFARQRRDEHTRSAASRGERTHALRDDIVDERRHEVLLCDRHAAGVPLVADASQQRRDHRLDERGHAHRRCRAAERVVQAGRIEGAREDECRRDDVAHFRIDGRYGGGAALECRLVFGDERREGLR